MVNKDIYPCSVDKLDILLIKHKYDITKEQIWKNIIHDKYCVHIEFHKDGKKNVCRRLKITGTELCKRHTPKNPEDIYLCIHDKCKRKVKNNNEKCIYHRTLELKELPFFRENDIIYLCFNSSLRKIKNKDRNKNQYTILNTDFLENNKSKNNNFIGRINNIVEEKESLKRSKIIELSKNDTNMTILPKNNNEYTSINKKQNIYFGSLEVVMENIPNENNILSFAYKKKVKRTFSSVPPLTFPTNLNLNDKITFFGEIKINTTKRINQRILFKLKSLIYFKNLYLNIKYKNINNNIYDEPTEYYSKNIDQLYQPRRTTSYLFDDINYMKKIYTSFAFLIKSFENKYGSPPGDAKNMINYILNLLKYPDFNVLNVDNNNDRINMKIGHRNINLD